MADQEQEAGVQPTASTGEQGNEGTKGQATTERETPIEQVRQLKGRIEALEKELATERDKATDYMNKAMRAQAEISNVRKRLQQDLALALKDALRGMVYEQLAVLDSFERAFATLPKEFEHFTWVDGMGLIHNQLYGILFRTGVTPIETKGKKFNPAEHEAVAYEETSNYPEDTVTAELQRGYKLHDQMLRPALVKIARSPQPIAAGNEAEKTSNDQ